jgi:hypothetical protein
LATISLPWIEAEPGSRAGQRRKAIAILLTLAAICFVIAGTCYNVGLFKLGDASAIQDWKVLVAFGCDFAAVFWVHQIVAYKQSESLLWDSMRWPFRWRHHRHLHHRVAARDSVSICRQA